MPEKKPQVKYVTVKHDGYVFHINSNSFYKTPVHVGTAPIGWYNDYNGCLQIIYRDSVYGAAVTRKMPSKEE